MPFININQCRSFKQDISTNLTVLTAQDCSEVIVYNSSTSTIELFDNGFYPTSGPFGFILSGGQTLTLRGITNSNQVSARAIGSTGQICYRTQFFSLFTQGV